MFYESQRIVNKNKLHNNAYDLVVSLKEKQISNQEIIRLMDLMVMTSNNSQQVEVVNIAKVLVLKGVV